MSPPPEAVALERETVADLQRALGAEVTSAREFSSLASRVFAVSLADGRRAVVKVPQVEQGTLAEPRLMELVRTETTVPVPEVVAVREDADPSYFVMNHLEGDTVDTVAALSPAERLALAREIGATLAALHELPLPFDTFGRIRSGDDGSLHTIESFESWGPRFADLLDVNLDALAELRLGDLEPRLREAFDAVLPDVPDATTPRLNYYDCKPANLVLSRDGDGPLVKGVLDWESLSTPHWAFTLAFAERNLVEWPGDAEPGERDRLRGALYDGYATSRGWENLELGEWYETYRLAVYALVAASPYWLQGRDDWDDEKAARLRRRIERFLD